MRQETHKHRVTLAWHFPLLIIKTHCDHDQTQTKETSETGHSLKYLRNALVESREEGENSHLWENTQEYF